MKSYSIAAILSVVSDLLLCDMDDVVDFMVSVSGCEIWSHDLVRIANNIRPWVLQQHPFLGDIDTSHVTEGNALDELAKIETQYGKELLVEPMPPGMIADLSLEESIKFAGFEGKVIFVGEGD